MSRLSELIAELCPGGVEYKAIKDVYRRLKGTPITAAKMKKIASDDGEITVFAGGKTKIRAHEKDIPNANITRVPALLVQSRGVIDFVYCDTPFTFKNEMWAYTADDVVSIRYLMYCLKNNAEAFRAAASGMGSLPQISLKVTENYRIPVPPIEVQREVVRILDEYTAAHDELVAQLEKEAALRTASLTALCDHEISRPESKRCPIHEVGQLERGRRFTAADYVEAGIPSIHYGEIYTAYGLSATRTVSTVRPDIAANLRYAHPGDVVIACTGENKDDICKAVAWLGDIDAAVHDDCQILHHDSDPRFIVYALMTSEFHDQKVRVASESKVVRVSSKKLASLRIPLPPIEEQRVTANRLDEIFSAINDLITSLDKERQNLEQQLALVRNQLLSFPEKVA